MNTRLPLFAMAIGLLLLIAGCSKPRKDDFFHIKHEIITTEEVENPYPIINATGGNAAGTYTNFTSGKKWEITSYFETSMRPVQVFLNGQNIRLKNAGKVTLNIYVNHKLKATSTRETDIFEGKHTVTTEPIGYVIN